MNHCNLRSSCGVCVGDNGCYWITLLNGTQNCYHDIVREGVKYNVLVDKVGGCTSPVIPDDPIFTATTAGLVAGAIGLTAAAFGAGWLIKRCLRRNQPARNAYVHDDRPRMFNAGETRSDRDMLLEPSRQAPIPFWGATFNRRPQRDDVELTSFVQPIPDAETEVVEYLLNIQEDQPEAQQVQAPVALEIPRTPPRQALPIASPSGLNATVQEPDEEELNQEEHDDNEDEPERTIASDERPAPIVAKPIDVVDSSDNTAADKYQPSQKNQVQLNPQRNCLYNQPDYTTEEVTQRNETIRFTKTKFK